MAVRLAAALIFLLGTVMNAEDLPKNPCPGHGYFSCEAVELYDVTVLATDKHPAIIFAPDHTRRMVIRRPRQLEGIGRVSVVVGNKSFPTTIGYHLNAEIMWAPDSSAFAETYSQGGAVGDYVLVVYRVSETGLHMIIPTRYMWKDFLSRPINCGGYREDPNVAAVRWGEDSKSLYVAAEILPHSVCDSMGTFRLYRIALPDGHILATWNQLQAKRQFWSSLGLELRDAEDDCIRDPAVCYVPYNHPECFPKDENKKVPQYCAKVLRTARDD